ncbi:ATP-binding protein [Treponema sp. OMZ 792]|uniref:ATP-binding protein n=1 Tax=unclassified Treponema TaxID=2638727 RepID=UPI0020A3657C|nr:MULTISPECIES: ATP-binding protein [unclassified Treponema]UTC74663.1 ATP-binding protein [Treponema sp. OMZ 792]UTC77015.1 ATP-binding protein [Treponema sp. OMZ 799]UTC81058.1 ATP-binding protein [Treponema sp. OMZ 798]
MIIMNLELDNLFGFGDFKVNFSYPKRPVKTSIIGEYLKTKPNFRYKKVNILMGANASGKTSLGQALKDIFNFIERGKFELLQNDFLDKTKSAYFSIDFLTDEEYLYRVSCKFSLKEIQEFDVYNCKILKNDSYESCVQKLKKAYPDAQTDFIQKLSAIPNIGWLFTFPKDESSTYLMENDIDVLKLDILNAVLKTLDTSITEVIASSELANAYIIRSKNGDVVIQNGQIVDKNILSSGTKAGLDISYLISAIYLGVFEFYYCDEQFSFIQSDIEQTILSLMISLLKPNTQLFFTTHNLDILEMNLPIHSFMFLRKDDKIQVVHPEEKIKKNDVSLRNAVKNDVFDISPDITKLLEIEDSCAEVLYEDI